MIPFFTKLSLLHKAGVVLLAVLALWAAKSLYDLRQQNIGAQKVKDRIEKIDKNTIKEKAKNDAEIQNKSGDDLVNELTR